MDLINTLLQRVTDLTNAFNKQTEDSRKTSELPDAVLPLNAGDLIRVEQAGVSRKTPYTNTATSSTQKVYATVANATQNTFTVPEGYIEDNGLWVLVVGGNNFFATNGVGSTPSGAVSINFATGVVTFTNKPNQGTSINFKYY